MRARAQLGTVQTVVSSISLAKPPPPASNGYLTFFGNTQQVLADVQAHDKMMAARVAYTNGLAAIAPQWQPLPTAPYPPIGDESGFQPATGTLALRLNRSQISADALQEPARAQAGLVAQAAARTPTLTPMFWVGLACLGAGIYLARK